MSATHRYILEPYKGMNTRYRCPVCLSRNKTFSRYIDAESSNYLHESVGRCERVDKCGYHYTPKRYFADNGVAPASYHILRVKTPPPLPPSFIGNNVFKASLANYGSNNLIKFLNVQFGGDITQSLVKKYFIGTSTYWPGSTVFWQIDKFGKIRAGKVMLYDSITGKRVKSPFNHITWAHKALKLQDYNLKQCLFGEHLLSDTAKPIAIVESEKTALISSVHLPQYIWLACGSLQNLSGDRCAAFRNRTTVLYPDLNAFDKWSAKGKELGFQTSEALEQIATESEREQGLDLADYLLNSNNKTN